MKRMIGVAAVIGVLLLAGCSGTGGGTVAEVPDKLPPAPAALLEDDGAATGVYLGVVAGPTVTGSFWVSIEDPAKGMGAKAFMQPPDLSATLNILINSKKLFTAVVTCTYTSSYLVQFSFTYEGIDYTLSYNLTTGGQIMTPAFSGETTLGISVVKALSTQAVETWEGTVAGSGTGGVIAATWNFTLAGGNINGTYEGTTTSDGTSTPIGGTFTATVSGAIITFISVVGGPDIIDGTFSGTSVSGHWSFSNGSSAGTWSGTRTQ